ncbi:hypothetical protein K457DRAFT_747912 [Linnemannia elongata AG-77]|uniref:Transmembrane protein n=1 Tax=Linnemannia elongata AG-77 TaxID=1314771 RepID=A0A197JMD3_9FUNG|nr:hypothetical protein K457DRAFT_747912 [Linnemannia elongata AG-77]
MSMYPPTRTHTHSSTILTFNPYDHSLSPSWKLHCSRLRVSAIATKVTTNTNSPSPSCSLSLWLLMSVLSSDSSEPSRLLALVVYLPAPLRSFFFFLTSHSVFKKKKVLSILSSLTNLHPFFPAKRKKRSLVQPKPNPTQKARGKRKRALGIFFFFLCFHLAFLSIFCFAFLFLLCCLVLTHEGNENDSTTTTTPPFK